MNLKKILLALALAQALPASAALLGATDLAGNSFLDYSAEGLLALDINAYNHAPLSFSVSFSAGEIAAGSVAFNAVINSLVPQGISGLRLDFGSLAVSAGSVQSAFDAGASGAYGVSQNGSLFSASRGGAIEYYGLLVGDPYVGGSLGDWQIATGNLVAGNAYAFSIQAVPEPAQGLLLLTGLGLLAGFARRRRG